MKREKGFTLIEIMMGVIILGIVAVAAFKLLRPGIEFFKRSQGRQTTNMEARKCMDTIKRFLSNAKVTTVTISTPTGAIIRPNAQIAFTTLDGTASYVITWSNTPPYPNSVHILKTSPVGSTNTTDTLIASNVSGLMFTGDFRDPGVINVSLQMSTLLDSSGEENAAYSILIPNEMVRMANSQ